MVYAIPNRKNTKQFIKIVYFCRKIKPRDVKRIELLAPAKDFAAAKVAVDAGADALYIGGARFGARRGAANGIGEVRRAVDYARPYGVRVYATLNTLLWDDELAEAEAEARALLAAGVDALIVQDMALRRLELGCELHASTQAQIRTPELARFLGEAGFSRVILERALSLGEIRRICATTTAEVECFVHGAICVGYSGACFLSRSMSPRSGNRGACSQPCRLKWDLTDAAGRRIITGKHLLSVRDLNLADRLGDLLDAGVSSFKIEGRLKDEGYIRNVVAGYRAALDAALAGRPGLVRASSGESRPDFTPAFAKSFTRGESHYFFDGRCRGVASFDTPKAVGEALGTVVACSPRGYRIAGGQPVAAGDGICLLTDEGLFGTNINAVEGDWIIPNRLVRVPAGTPVYRNYDHLFQRQLAASRMRRTIAVEARCEASAAGVALQLTDCDGIGVRVERTVPLDRTQHPDRNAEAVVRQLQRSGETIFEVRRAEVAGAEWFVPASLAADLRREGLERLLQRRLEQPPVRRLRAEDRAARYPAAAITATENVTNRLAAAFYRDHGVERIEPPLERAASTVGCEVMRSAYCLRRELGECLREHPRLQGDLYLETGGHRYRLDFDCRRCEMRLIDSPAR